MKKLNNISFIKTITMLVVVLYHSMLFYTGNWFTVIKPVKVLNYIDYITTFINTYTMPIFVFCSGYLFFYQKRKNNKYNNLLIDIKKRFNRLVIPYIFTSLLWIIPIGIVLFKYTINDIIKKFVLGMSPSQLWFLLMLFIVFIINYFLANKLKFTKKEFALIIFITFILNYLSKYIPNYYQICTSFSFLIYFYFGGFIYSKSLNIKCSKTMKKILILLSLISYISLDIIPNEGYIHYLIIIYKQFVVLLGVITIYINISSCNIEKICSNKIYKMFENNSFGIYLFHQQIIYFIILIFNYILNPIITIVLSFILSITISNFMVLILQKNKFTKFIFGL